MNEKQLTLELNKILTLEHGHLGMYSEFLDHQEKEIRQTFRVFTEIEVEHIKNLKGIIKNLGAKPLVLIETGDVFGKLLGITMRLGSTRSILETYGAIEKKSHQGYSDFITKLEQDTEKREQFIAELLLSNMLEAKLMQLWLENALKNY